MSLTILLPSTLGAIDYLLILWTYEKMKRYGKPKTRIATLCLLGDSGSTRYKPRINTKHPKEGYSEPGGFARYIKEFRRISYSILNE